VLAARKPLVFKEEIYAVWAMVAGGVCRSELGDVCD